jgi:alkylation response protein AidB-like acyl-CoA dehydrogenase
MDFRDSPEEAAFRERAAAWLDESLADIPSQEGLSQEDRERWSGVWQSRLSDGGWAGLTWPPEVGGGGLEVVYQAVFNEEASRRDAPYALNGVGTMLAGPTILAHGSDEQKARFRPSSRASSTGARASASPGPAPISRAYGRPRARSKGAGGSAARRSGPRTPIMPSAACCSPAPTPRRRSTRGSRTSWRR